MAAASFVKSVSMGTVELLFLFRGGSCPPGPSSRCCGLGTRLEACCLFSCGCCCDRGFLTGGLQSCRPFPLSLRFSRFPVLLLFLGFVVPEVGCLSLLYWRQVATPLQSTAAAQGLVSAWDCPRDIWGLPQLLGALFVGGAAPVAVVSCSVAGSAVGSAGLKGLGCGGGALCPSRAPRLLENILSSAAPFQPRDCVHGSPRDCVRGSLVGPVETFQNDVLRADRPLYA